MFFPFKSREGLLGGIMDINAARSLFRNADTVTAEEVQRAVLNARIEPEAARDLWNILLNAQDTDENLRLAFDLLLQSVLIDQISHQVGSDDSFALVIGRRIATILEQITGVVQSQHVNTA